MSMFAIHKLQMLGIFLVGAALIAVAGPKAKPISTPSPILLSPPAELKLFTFGYNETIADILWLRAIQDIDICEKAGVSARQPVKSFDTPDYDPNDPNRITKCHEGWPFRMMFAMTDIAPKFEIPFTIGAIILSVLGEDQEGASKLFDRGMERLPKDEWNFRMKAAYHYMIEEKNDVKAARALQEAAENKEAPYWVASLAARLLTKEGRVELAKKVLKEQADRAETESTRQFFERRLAEVEARAEAADKASKKE